MRLESLGEFGLIKRLKNRIKLDSAVVKGTGDDCAVIKFDAKSYELFTCDMIVEDVDFTRRDNPYLVGRKAVAVSISDIAACAGIPRHAVVSIGIPKKTSVSYLDKIFKGMTDIAKEFDINIVGGDISKAKELVIDVSMLGLVEKNKLVLRNGAKIGDIIFVTGPLGGSIRGKHLKFTPRVLEARYLVDNFKVNSMIDISDGLLQDLGHIMEESNTGALIYEDLIPLSEEARSIKEALTMGEDFELLFTVPNKEAKKIMRAVNAFLPIGEIREKKHGLRLLNTRGKEQPLALKGFTHF